MYHKPNIFGFVYPCFNNYSTGDTCAQTGDLETLLAIHKVTFFPTKHLSVEVQRHLLQWTPLIPTLKRAKSGTFFGTKIIQGITKLRIDIQFCKCRYTRSPLYSLGVEVTQDCEAYHAECHHGDLYIKKNIFSQKLFRFSIAWDSD